MKTLTRDELEDKDPNFLFIELLEILDKRLISFKLVVQIAEVEDIIDNYTNIWLEEQRLEELEMLKFERTLDESELSTKVKKISFNLVLKVKDVEASADPIIAA